MTNKPTIGVLALQGAVQPHKAHIEGAGAEFRAVKTPAQFDAVDAFILPGGESTTMLKLIERFDLWDCLERNFKAKPVWGICAGAILMAEKVLVQPKLSSKRQRHSAAKTAGIQESEPQSGSHMDPVRANASNEACQQDDEKWETQKSFGLLPITVERNGYGRQLDSHHAQIEGYTVSFIRAPIIADAGATNVKARHQGDPVWVERGQYMATTFHPELTLEIPSPMHRAFADFVRHFQSKQAA